MELNKDEAIFLLTQHYGNRRLQIAKGDDLEATVNTIIQKDLGDFCWSMDFCEFFIQQLFTQGFVPICTQVPFARKYRPIFVLLPKLHRIRCLLQNFTRLHVDRGARKKSRKYHMTIDSAFGLVIEGCIEQHGESWLWPPMRDALLRLFEHSQHNGVVPGTAKLHSIELWNEEGNLAAGELGYSCGAMYTSLTGFHREPSTGTIQMLCIAGLLVSSSFVCWDLGMAMSYKERLGARGMDRTEFVAMQRSLRDVESASLPALQPPGQSASSLIDIVRAGAANSDASI
mmetsp:Transcript_137768/g.274726  ORF Transcript_137768/g.274726 Transcript_137768/m.274726 type:complete len:286 (-) Transcript_137768:88-945(-)